MPLVVVLLLVAFFGIALRLYAVPVSQDRFDRFLGTYSLEPSAANRSRLWAYLAVRRRVRIAGVLVAAVIGLFGSIPQQRVEFGFVSLFAGWFAAAVAVELSQRAGGVRTEEPVRVPYWWTGLPVVTAVVAVLWTVAAVWLRSEGVTQESLVGWGAGALATALVLRAVVVHIGRHSLRDLDPADPAAARATTVDAVCGLAIGGVALALLCLAQVWTAAVPGPYVNPSEVPAMAWLLAIGAVMLAMGAAVPSIASRRLMSWKWLVYPAVAALPLLWAVPVRAGQEAPISAQDAIVGARLRIVRLDGLAEAQAEFGLEPDPLAGQNGHPETLPKELIGRIDVIRPAPAGSSYQAFGFDRRTNGVVNLYGAKGGTWYGAWSRVLPVRYPWLSNVIGRPDTRGFMHDPMAASADPESGVLWFRDLVTRDVTYSAEDIQLVLMLVRNKDSYIYWAAMINR